MLSYEDIKISDYEDNFVLQCNDMNKLKDKMLAGAKTLDKFAAADAAMALGGLVPTPAEVVEAKSSVKAVTPTPIVNPAMSTAKVPTGAGRAVRESISLLAEESKVIDELRVKLAALGTIPNRSEVLRAGILALNNLSAIELEKFVQQVPKLKPGRPT